jgi:hypothetical protein
MADVPLKVLDADSVEAYMDTTGEGTAIDPHKTKTVVAGALPAGDNNIGNVDVETLPAVKIDQATANANEVVTKSGSVVADAAVLAKLVEVLAKLADVDITTLPAIPAGTNNIGDVDVATLPSVKIDQATANANEVVTKSGSVSADSGAGWATVRGVSGAAVVSADATTATAVTDAPTGGQKIVITDIIFSSDTEMNLLFEEQDSGTDVFKVFVPANGAGQITPRGKCKLATADKKLTVKASAAGNIAVTVLYYSEA